MKYRSNCLLLSSLFLLPVASSSLAQVGQHRRLPSEPLEKYDMPPAKDYFTFFSARMVVPASGYTSYQINVNPQGLNIIGDAANEPSMVLDPTDQNKMAVGWRQFNSVTSNFRQGGYAFTTNGGLTWMFPGVLQNNVFRSDPVLNSTSNGTFHYNSLQQTFFSDEYRSANQGQSWNLLGPATGGDKQWITVDRSTSTGAGFVYQLWSTAGNNYNGRQFSRSIDGGTTWMTPINLPNQPIWGTMDVASNGDLYLCGVDQNSASFWFERSQNAKNGAVTPSFNLVKNVSLGGDLSFGPPTNPGGLGGQVWIAVDRSGGANDGNIYMLCSTDRDANNRCDVMITRSTDGGNNWSTPIRINDDAPNQNRYHWFGALSVAPNGRVDVCWLDTRNDASNATSQLYYSFSSDGGATFAPNVQVSPSFNSTIGWPQQNKIGDYMAITGDKTGANIVYPATFNGEQDVYFVRIPQSNVVTVTPDSFSLFRGVLLSGLVSDLFQSDTDYVKGRAGLVANINEPPFQINIDGTSPTATPSDLAFTLVTKASATALSQRTLLFNYQTNLFEQLDARSTTLTDSTLVIRPSGDLSRFVNPSTMKMRARIAVKQVGIVPAVWSSWINQSIWTVTP